MPKIDWNRTVIRPTGYDAEGNVQWGIREEIYETERTRKRIVQVSETTAKIELSRGFWALVDIEDLPRLKKHSWSVNSKSRPYAITETHRIRSLMSKFILNYQGPLEVDHINRDTLDNRKSNLRILDGYLNRLNNAGSGINFRSGSWQARVRHYHRSYSATFKTKEEAIAWRKRKIEELLNE